MSPRAPARRNPAAAIVVLPLTIAAASASAAATGPVPTALAPLHATIPLPSSALMGFLVMGGVAAFTRFPGHRRKRS